MGDLLSTPWTMDSGELVRCAVSQDIGVHGGRGIIIPLGAELLCMLQARTNLASVNLCCSN